MPLPLLAVTPPPPALLCTVSTAQSSWTTEPIRGIRLLENQTFRVTLGTRAAVNPRYVIESRLTSLAEETSAPVGSIKPDASFSYRWNYRAPLGPIALPNQEERELTVQVERDLNIQPHLNFHLHNSTVVRASGASKPLTELKETARGTCREQR